MDPLFVDRSPSTDFRHTASHRVLMAFLWTCFLAVPFGVPQVFAADVGSVRGVVSDRGTAAAAAVPGFTIAGKTGTAQKVGPHGGYEKGKEVVSFCGYLPAENPQFVGLVVLDDAQTKPEQNYGGTVAGPIFSHIAEKAARYLDLEPHEEIRKAVPVERVALTSRSRH